MARLGRPPTARLWFERHAEGLSQVRLPAGQGRAEHPNLRPQELMSEAEIAAAYQKAGRGYG